MFGDFELNGTVDEGDAFVSTYRKAAAFVLEDSDSGRLKAT